MWNNGWNWVLVAKFCKWVTVQCLCLNTIWSNFASKQTVIIPTTCSNPNMHSLHKSPNFFDGHYKVCSVNWQSMHKPFASLSCMMVLSSHSLLEISIMQWQRHLVPKSSTLDMKRNHMWVGDRRPPPLPIHISSMPSPGPDHSGDLGRTA